MRSPNIKFEILFHIFLGNHLHLHVRNNCQKKVFHFISGHDTCTRGTRGSNIDFLTKTPNYFFNEGRLTKEIGIHFNLPTETLRPV